MLKKQRRRRWLSGLRAAVMVLSMLPVSVWASYKKPEGYEPPEGASQTYVFSIEGTALQYTFYRYSDPTDPTGKYIQEMVITVDPESTSTVCSIPDYTTVESRPWNEAATSLQAVYVGDGVTGIGQNAFSNMTALRELDFEDPSDLTYIPFLLSAPPALPLRVQSSTIRRTGLNRRARDAYGRFP